MDKHRSHRQKRISLRQEKNAAADIGGRTVAGSGAAKHSGGGDVRKRGALRIECKYTESPFYYLSLSELTKIRIEALKGGLETPIMQIDFISPHTGVHDLYAVRGVMPRSAPIMVTTARKRITIHKEELQREILHHGSAHVVFLRGTAKSEDVLEILPWGKFVEEWEEQESEC